MSVSDERKKAIIITLSEYDNLEPLEFCKNDGKIMYETLTKLGYEIPENRFIVGSASGSTIRKAVIDFFRDPDVKPSDTLLFYLSGHGVLDGYEGRYFASSNTNPDIPEEDGVSFNLLTQQMDRSLSLKTIAILDCCFSGAAVPGVTGKGGQVEEEAEKLGREALSKQFKDSKGKCVLASSLSQRRSYNLPEHHMSAFTHFIVEGLKGKKESVDKDGYVTPEKLDQYVYTELANLKTPAPQTPVRNLSISGRIVLAHYPELSESNLFKLTAKSDTENQENSNFGFWMDIKNKIKSASTEIEKNSVIDDFAKSAIDTIPVIGLLFLKLYDASTGSDEEKTTQLYKIFDYLDNLDEEKLEKFCRNLKNSEKIILKAGDFLHQLSIDTESIIFNPPVSKKPEISKNAISVKKYNTPKESLEKTSHENASEFYEHGVSLYMEKKFEEAAKVFDHAYALDSNLVDAIRFKGRSLASLNRHQAAIYYFDKVLTQNPNDMVVLFLKANSLTETGKTDEAIACYGRILQIQPDNQVAKNKKSALMNSHKKRRFGMDPRKLRGG